MPTGSSVLPVMAGLAYTPESRIVDELTRETWPQILSLRTQVWIPDPRFDPPVIGR